MALDINPNDTGSEITLEPRDDSEDRALFLDGALVVGEPAKTEALLQTEAKPTDTHEAMTSIARARDAVKLHREMMAFELPPEKIGEAHPSHTLMQWSPFAGPHPVVFGNDLTDEAALRWANATSSASVHISAGNSCVSTHIDGPAVLDQLNGESVK